MQRSKVSIIPQRNLCPILLDVPFQFFNVSVMSIELNGINVFFWNHLGFLSKVLHIQLCHCWSFLSTMLNTRCDLLVFFWILKGESSTIQFLISMEESNCNCFRTRIFGS